jgi:hypothetical protein
VSSLGSPVSTLTLLVKVVEEFAGEGWIGGDAADDPLQKQRHAGKPSDLLKCPSAQFSNALGCVAGKADVKVLVGTKFGPGLREAGRAGGAC